MAAKTRAQTTPATNVVIPTLSHMRGFSGALDAIPISGSAGGRAPQGSTVNKTNHQITTYAAAPVNQVMSGLLQLDKGAAEVLGVEEQNRLAMGANTRLSVAENA